MVYIQLAKNGLGKDLQWRDKSIYYNSNSGVSLAILGNKTGKDNWIMENIGDIKNTIVLKRLLASWELYENGWLYRHQDSQRSRHLFNYLCQIGNNTRPIELRLLKNK